MLYFENNLILENMPPNFGFELNLDPAMKLCSKQRQDENKGYILII